MPLSWLSKERAMHIGRSGRQEKRVITADRTFLKYRTAFILFLVLSLTVVFSNVSYVAAIDDGWMTYEEVKIDSYCVIDGNTGEVILEHNADVRRQNASTTKIMTALTLLNDENYDPDLLLKVSKPAITLRDPRSARIKGLKEGDEIRSLDALGALLIASANDVSRVIAQNYGGAYGAIDPDNLNDPEMSQELFMKKMNILINEMGLENTHFTNPAGFDTPDRSHYTTARDIAYITLEALKNPQIAHIVGLRRYRLPSDENHKDAFWAPMSNSNGLIMYGADMLESQYFVRYTGVKTGTTPQAGKCLVGSGVTQDGRLIICAALGITLPSAYASNQMYARAIPVRALMEEGAKRLGCPVIENRVHLLTPTFPTVPATTSVVPSEPSDAQDPDDSSRPDVNVFPGVIGSESGSTDEPGETGLLAIFKALPVTFQILMAIGLLAVLVLFIWLFVRVAGSGRRRRPRRAVSRDRTYDARRQHHDPRRRQQIQREPYSGEVRRSRPSGQAHRPSQRPARPPRTLSNRPPVRDLDDSRRPRR